MIVVTAAALLAGVFVAPYFVPSHSALLSASALAGFNNSVAYVAYIVLAPTLGVLLATRLPRQTPRPPFEPDVPVFAMPSPVPLAVIAGHIVLFAGLQLTKGFVLAEALYFEDATYRVLHGAIPFVDFNFFYGPLLLYPAVAAARVIGVEAGYAAAFALMYAAGLYLLFCVIAQFTASARARTAWFLIVSVGLFNPILGFNYTFLRFLLPLVTLFAGWRMLRGFTKGRSAAAALTFTAALLCSPDIAAVTTAGLGVMTLVMVWRSPAGRRAHVLGAATMTGVAALIIAVASLYAINRTIEPAIAYLRPIATFSAGAWNTPIDPSLPVLTLLVLTIFVFAHFAASWRRGDASPVAPLAVGYLVVLLLMQRASFGKADVLHIAYSGLPIYLAAVRWADLRVDGPRTAGVVAGALLLGVSAPLQAYHAMLFLPAVAPATVVHAAAATAATPSPSKRDIQRSLAHAVDHFGADRTYYMHRLEYYRLPIYERYQLRPFLFHPSLTSAFNAADIDDVKHALRRSGAVVLARKADLVLAPEVPQYREHWWHVALSTPVPGSHVYNLTLQFQDRLERPLVRFLTTEYIAAFDEGEIVGLVPRAGTQAHPDAVQ